MADRNGKVTGQYVFGDTDLAAARLATVAEVFAPTSRSFLSDFAHRPFELALDLGCGTGHTTHLIAKVLRPRHTIGMDYSKSFVSLARLTVTNGLSFIEHDGALPDR
jgi:trans-aconitate methyltransferase